MSRVDESKVLCIIHVLRYGLRWADAPPVDGPYKTLYNRFRRWLHNGGFLLIFLELARSDGAEPEEVLMIDATYLKAHRMASSLKKGVRMSRPCRGLTNKLHGVCDKQGRPVRFHLVEGAME